ncbi:MAG TPA: pectin acetylesterase-family hydrolase [Polyangiaceae bacterium]|jgi:hypothetical protein|nr:pectin acetylesterase-family hydrolase [Polyangiaceae bacterium]
MATAACVAGAAALSVACSSNSRTSPLADRVDQESQEAALGVPGDGAWHWYDSTTSPAVTGMTCLDGSPTGFAVNVPPGGGNNRLLVYLEGGGGCWDSATGPCTWPHVAKTSYQFTDFQDEAVDMGSTNAIVLPFVWSKPALGAPACEVAGNGLGPTGCSGRGIFDRATGTANNPFASYTFVFVPYCSGDDFEGLNLDTASSIAGRTATMANFSGALDAATVIGAVKGFMPSPRSIVVAGASAGGLGAYFHYATFRFAYPSLAIPITIISDSAVAFATGVPSPSNPGVWNCPAGLCPTGAQGYYLSTPESASAPLQTSYLEDAFEDAWHISVTAGLYPQVRPVSIAGARGPIVRQQDIYVAAATAHPAIDQFGFIMGNDDWILPTFYDWTTDSMPPNAATAIADFQTFLAAQGLTNVKTLPITSTASYMGQRAWNAQHEHLLDDVSVWTPQDEGMGDLLGFLVTTLGIPSD